MSRPRRELESGDEHRVTPFELFFDWSWCSRSPRSPGFLVDQPTWSGVLRGMLVLAALWWAWNGYAWLTSATDVDEGGVRLALLASMGAILVVAVAVPGAFGDDAVLFGAAYLLVRLLHLVLSAIVARDDPDSRGALLRLAPTAILGASLLVVAGFLDRGRIAVWLVALAIDYLGPVVIGIGRGWGIAAEHFAERFGLITPTLVANGDNDRMVPSTRRGPSPAHRGLRADHLPRLRARRHLPVRRRVRPRRRRVPRPLTTATAPRRL